MIKINFLLKFYIFKKKKSRNCDSKSQSCALALIIITLAADIPNFEICDLRK